MTWEDKLAALKSLAPTHLEMRVQGNWYVSDQGVEIGGDGMLGSLSGNGDTPEKAVEDHWRQIISLPTTKYLVINAGAENRRHFRWNGFMWAEIAVNK